MYNLEIIPFSNFKQKLSLLKEFSGKGCSIETFDKFICISKFNIHIKDGAINERYAE